MNQIREVDAFSGTETTGHTWDGIKELNTPLPRWWLWTYYATILFALGYVIAYPAIPGLTGASKGLLGWSSRGDLQAALTAAEAGNADRVAKIAAADVTAIAADPDLSTFAKAAGASIFKVQCVQCHGSGATGGPGYPNLNDDSWLWGGTLADIQTTLQHGVRYTADSATRVSEMPAFGRDGVLKPEEITDVAAYVRKLSNQQADDASATRGQALFAANCAACHGEKGEGNKDMGAPQLNDAIWLYGGEQADIERQVTLPRHGVMPAWQTRLGDVAVKELTVYVHSLGGGQ
jgi:cytochrome c oxidase cbb3-type subunit 3